MASSSLSAEPAVQWFLHKQPITIEHAIPDFANHRVLGFHIRFPATGEERDIYWDDKGEIDGFEYEETAQ